MNCYIVVLAFMFIIRFLLSQCNTLVNSAALTGGLASQLSLLFTLARPTTKLVIVNNSSMKTITGDARTLDFSNLPPGAGFGLSSSELFGCYVGISCLAKQITNYIMLTVWGLSVWIVRLVAKHLLGMR